MTLFIIAVLLFLGIMFFINRNTPEELRPDWLDTAETVLRMLWNKGFAILVLAGLMYHYATLDKGDPTPFAEILYACILAGCIFVGGPVFRLLVFPEAAEYAESGKLRDSLAAGKYPYALQHYRFATAISFAAVALCVSSLL